MMQVPPDDRAFPLRSGRYISVYFGGVTEQDIANFVLQYLFHPIVFSTPADGMTERMRVLDLAVRSKSQAPDEISHARRLVGGNFDGKFALLFGPLDWQSQHYFLAIKNAVNAAIEDFPTTYRETIHVHHEVGIAIQEMEDHV